MTALSTDAEGNYWQ